MEWGEPSDAVVSPSEFPGEFAHRHQFDHGDSERGELRQFAAGGIPGTFAGERAHVHLAYDLPVNARALTIRISPPEARRIDDLRRSVRALGLKPRCRIGERV